MSHYLVIENLYYLFCHNCIYTLLASVGRSIVACLIRTHLYYIRSQECRFFLAKVEYIWKKSVFRRTI